jgi:hypothetical protein
LELGDGIQVPQTRPDPTFAAPMHLQCLCELFWRDDSEREQRQPKWHPMISSRMSWFSDIQDGFKFPLQGGLKTCCTAEPLRADSYTFPTAP